MVRSLRTALLFFAALGASCAGGSAGPRFERFPMETTPPADAYPVVGAVVLLERGTLTFNADAEHLVPLVKLRRYHREKILRPEVHQLSRVLLPYDPGSAIADLIVQLVLPDGSTIWIDEITDVPSEDGRRAKAFAVPKVPAGAVLEYAYDTYFKDPRFLPSWVFGSVLPTVRSELAVVVPQGFEIDLRYCEDGVPADRPPERFEQDGATRLSWSLADLPAFFPEVSRPDLERVAPVAHVLFVGARIAGRTFSGFRSWDDVRRWFIEERIGDWARLSPEQAQEAQRIAGDAPVEERALKLMEVVARDLPWTPGPRPPLWRADAPSAQNTLISKQGNATSRGLLLTALMRAAGVEALPAFYARRSHALLLPDFPVVRHVDGIAAVVPRPSGPLVLDPSELTVSAEVPAAELQGTRVIALRDDQAEVMLVPVSSTADSRTTIAYDLRVEPSGRASGTAEARLTGAEASALRALLLPSPPVKHPELIAAFFAERGVLLPLDGTNIADLDALRRPLVIKGPVTAAGIMEDDGEAAKVRLERLLAAPGVPVAPRRRYPLLLGAPKQIEVIITLLFPEDHRPGEPPPPITQQWAGGGHQLSVRSETAHRVGIKAVTEAGGLEITTAEYPAYYRAREAITRALKAELPIQRPPPKTYQY